MKLALLQATEPAEPYSTLTIVLVAAFIVLIAILSGLLLRISVTRQQAQDGTDDDERFLAGHLVAGSGRAPTHTGPEREFTGAPALVPVEQSAPAWLRGSPFAASIEAVAAITATVQALLNAARAGDARAGFDLYTPEHLNRFRTKYGFDQETFEAMLNTRWRTNPASPAETGQISNVRIVSPDTVEADISYVQPAGYAPATERYRFVQAEDGRWLIDDIAAVD